MKKRKIGGRILSAVIASVMLFSSMTVFAAEAPSGIDNLEDTPEGWEELGTYMQRLTDDPNVIIYDANTPLSTAQKYFENGVYIVPYSTLKSTETILENDPTWDEAKAAVKALYAASVTADGTNCISEELWERETTIWDKINEIDDKIQSGLISQIGQGEEEPDVSAMDRGTYWCTESEVDAFWNSVESAKGLVSPYMDNAGTEYETWKTVTIYFYNGNENDEVNIVPSSAFENYVLGLENACKTLIGALHEGTKETATPVESLKTVSKSSSSSKSSSKQEEEPAPALVNEVLYSTGTKKQSSIEGVYGQTFVAGTIFNDEQAKIKQAAGLSEEEIKSGVVIKYYICNSLNKKMNEKLSSVVTGQGYKVLGVMNCDLYKLEKGNITKIKTTGEALTVTIGVPENLRNDKYEFVVMCYDESGNLVTMQDLDTDKNTITVQANSFGYWAIGYKTK